ncbi:MAG: hypothetical protein PHD76_14790, partial [Methylacidiphilales bacterium]|nr:hypothetical protein [Candidatus Methylacidiphilales bacterium]
SGAVLAFCGAGLDLPVPDVVSALTCIVYTHFMKRSIGAVAQQWKDMRLNLCRLLQNRLKRRQFQFKIFHSGGFVCSPDVVTPLFLPCLLAGHFGGVFRSA